MNQTKAPDNTSLKEKERLKKRLHTLFKNEKANKSFTGHLKGVDKITKDKQNPQVNGQPTKKNVASNTKQIQEEKSGMKMKLPKNKTNASTDKQKKQNPTNNTTTQNVLANNSKTQNSSQDRDNYEQTNKKQKPKKASEIPVTQIETNLKQKTTKKNVPFNGKTSQPLNSSATNGQQKMSKNQKKKAKKRAAASSVLNSYQTENKKPKLTENNKGTNQGKKSKPLHTEPLQNKLNTASFQNNEYDLNNLSGFVQAGDIDSEDEDYTENQYWMHKENYSSDDDGASNESNFDSDEIDDDDIDEIDDDESDDMLQMYDHGNNGDMKLYDHDESGGSEEDYFDSDEYDDTSNSEEEQNYTDFDENDYEEDEDSYNYSMDSDIYSSNYDEYDDIDDMPYHFQHDDNDSDYKLPKHVAEDLIIHAGTATKRDIKPDDNISFSDNDKAQIIELEEQKCIKVIKQPKAYDKEELLKLKYEEKTIKALRMTTNTSSDSKDCPKLVPIIDEDGFQLYNANESDQDDVEQELYDKEGSIDDVSLGSEYIEIHSDDADSTLSVDINEKYLNRGDDDDSDSSVDDSVWIKQQKVDVIDATSCKNIDYMGENPKEDSDDSLNDDIKQLPSQQLFEHVNLKSKCSILSTTIIDDKSLKTNIDNAKESNNQVNADEEIANMDNTNSETFKQDDVIENVSLETLENNDTSQYFITHSDDRVKTAAHNIVKYNTKFYNALDSNIVLVLLKDPFYIYGTVRLTLLAGVVDVYGHSLPLNKEVEIFSPRGCSEIEIASTHRTKITSTDNLKEIFKSFETNFALADLKSISDSYNGETDAVLLLKRNEGRKKIVQQFKKFMNENVFPNISNINLDRPLYNSEYLLRCMINTSTNEQKCLRLPIQWQQLSVTQQSRVMLTGGKGVGKSTLLRFLINRHLPKFKQILLIDLDIGQPEIFVPQTVSCSVITQPLLGPGFLLNIQPGKSFAVGHTNIALCAHKYLEAVRSLISHCLKQNAYKEMPWLINTMGYNKGFGLELISVIAKELPLTDVIQLQSTKEINNFDSILFSHVVSNVPHNMFIEEDFNKDNTSKLDYRLHVWQSAVQQESRYQKEWDMSAKDLRYAILLARLSEALQGNAEWLTDCKPLSAPLDQIKLVNLMENSPSSSQEELAKAIEANLVYLCHHEDASRPMECLGIGVVRGIDFHVRQLYLLPAMASSLVKHVNCLAIGEMPLPTSLFTNQGSRVKNLAPFVYNTVAAKASKAIKQIYHRPREFLAGTHKSLD